MKKKIILNILIIGILFVVTGCGKVKNLKATIIDNEGTITELTYNEFNELTENEAKFANLYEELLLN